MEKKRVILADSSRSFCAKFADALQENEYFVLAGIANEGEEAIRLIKELQPDILILDLMLAKLDGISVLEVTSNMKNQPYVISITPFITDYVGKRIKELGSKFLLFKPFSIDVLLWHMKDLTLEIAPRDKIPMPYKYGLDYIVRTFWDGEGKSIDDLDGKKNAIRRAVKDMMARTLKRKVPETENFTDAIIKALLPKINEWFCKTEAKISEGSFDKWHHQSCSVVLSVLQDFYINQDGTDVAYGKAQKIVNMTMKGLYCLSGAKEREHYFKYCHMALDSFILEWFCRQVMPWYNEKKENKENKEKIKKTSITSWSIIPEGCGVAPYGYNNYVRIIRDYFGAVRPYDGLTPLQAEFYIWIEIQLEMAAESLYGQGIGKEEAVKDAEEDWDVQWTSKEKGNIDKQFERCKKEFKLRPLKEKVAFLRKRIGRLCEYVIV